MNKRIVAILCLVVVVTCGVLASTLLHHEPVETEQEGPGETLSFPIAITDYTGSVIKINSTVKRIVTLSVGATEIICALGCADLIVGRDAYSIFPDSILGVPVVGESGYSFSLETFFELEPDLLVTDTTIRSNVAALEKIREQKIPVIIEDMGSRERVKALIKNLGILLGKDTRANELIRYLEYYENLVKERIKNVTPEEKPKVYVEWWENWQSFAEGSPVHDILVEAGGVNIASGSPSAYPMLSPEFVIEQNPEVIIWVAIDYTSGKNITYWNSMFQQIIENLMTRPELKEVEAVKNGRINVINFKLCVGIRYPVELLYFAKWLYPDRFTDVDPHEVHRQLIQQFLGAELEGVYAH